MDKRSNVTNKPQETAVLVGLITKDQDEKHAIEYLDELAFLAETAGALTVKKYMQKMGSPDPRTYIGSGKLNEIRDYIKENKVVMAIFDDELSGSQIKNIEKVLECRILDRNTLILDIFAKRARSAQAKTQVELAQYKYLLPRLTRMWTHLEKQRGGIGMRGPGEAEIETDKRVIKEKISRLKDKLKEIEKQTFTQRKQREDMIRVALTGYTNAGKSTIMNLIAKSDVFAENKLFATLDTTVRKVVIDNIPFLLSDTVGFIRKLPHDLVESFKSTLDEVREADILIHVVDISHPSFEDQINVVNQTLVDIKASDKPTILVFNKIDAYTYVKKDEDDLTPMTEENISLDDLKKSWLNKTDNDGQNQENMVIFLSAITKENVKEFRKLMVDKVKEKFFQKYPNYLL
ncbi:MAG: GTPase HflX [Bacteroidota bacterium]